MTSTSPRISIVIPSRNNLERLTLTLDSIRRVNFDPRRIEVVIVDDGSTDGTYEAVTSTDYPFAVKLRRAEYSNQSAATNEGIRHATGEYVLLSASDIIFHEELLNEHLAWHEKFPDDEVGVLGYLPYAEHLDVTPFMFYLVNGGFQFAYYMIRDPCRVPPNFTYAPNFSISRSVFDRVDTFDEQFPFGCQDTDLGIRLVQAGVRIVYNCKAIGYHNHPVTREAFLRRQEMAGEALVRLQQKHPDYEGGVSIWDLVLAHLLAYPRSQYDCDLETIVELERALTSTFPEYQKLWVRAFNNRQTLDRFSQEEQASLLTAQALFKAYNRILQYHWARGFLEESMRMKGAERVREILIARLIKTQTSMLARRVVERRLAEFGMGTLQLVSARDYLTTRIVYGIENYDRAVRHLERHVLPETAVCNEQLLLVVRRGELSDDHIARLDEVADVVTCDDLDGGVRKALARAEGGIITVTSVDVAVAYPQADLLSEMIFDRFAEAAVLGGAVPEPKKGKLRYGYSFQGGHEGRALEHSMEETADLTPIDAAIPEYLVVRKSAAQALLDETGTDTAGSWSVDLCRRTAKRGGLILHVPEFRTEQLPGPAVVRV